MNKQQDKRGDKQHVIWEEHLARTLHTSGIFERKSAAGEPEGEVGVGVWRWEVGGARWDMRGARWGLGSRVCLSRTLVVIC